MKHRLLIPLLIAIVLSSCVHDSPFRTEQYFQAMGREGEFVLTVNTRSWNILDGVLPAAVLERTDRLSVALESDGGIYGGAEGNFGYTGVNAVLDWSPDFRLVDGDLRYFQSRSVSLEAAVPRSGILLFSSSSYPQAYAATISDRAKYIDDALALEMAGHDGAVYAAKPSSIPDAGIAIPDETARKIDRLMLLFDEEDSRIHITGWIDMDSESSARTLSTLLRNELLKSIRQKGEKPDFSVLSGYFTCKGDTVYIDYPEMDRSAVEAMVKASTGGF